MQHIRLVSGRYRHDATLRGGAKRGWFCGWVALAHANVHLLISYLASTQPVFRAVCQLVREGKLQREIGGIGTPLQRHRVLPRMTIAPSLESWPRARLSYRANYRSAFAPTVHQFASLKVKRTRPECRALVLPSEFGDTELDNTRREARAGDGA